MADFVFIVITVAFFAMCLALVIGVQRLMEP